MAYGSALVDSITSSGNLSVSGNLTGITDITGTANVITGQGVLRPLLSTTPVATTSGTTVNLATNLPSWVKRLTVVFASVGITTTTVLPRIQLGYGLAPTFETTGYNSVGDNFNNTPGPTTSATNGFVIGAPGANYWYLTYMICNIEGTNIWVGSTTGAYSDATTPTGVLLGGGTVTLTDTLTAVRLFISSSSFSSGSAYVLYE